MYGIALSVEACLRGGTRIDVAWNLDPHLTPDFDPADAVGITPGGGRLGGLLGGALDSRLVEIAESKPTSGRIVHVELSPLEATMLGLEPGTILRLMMTPAELLPPDVWALLLERAPVEIAAVLADDRPTAFALGDPPTKSAVTVDAERAVTAWAPRPTLVVMGPGPMAAAVAAAGSFVGWAVETTPGPEPAIGLAASLSAIDGIVVVGHDIEATGRVLQAALGSKVGYIGSLGPSAVLDAREDWLAYRGVTDLDRIHSPAGLDIGASSPPEVGIAVVAEMIAGQQV